MHTHQSSLLRVAGRMPALLSSIALLVLASLVCVASARAADGSQFSKGQYGEVPTARFGGFDSTWYDEGAFDGGGAESFPTPGKFLYPAGFAVDTSDPGGTAIYVLDRVSASSEVTSEPGTRWRLQKLTETGTPVARTEFFLPKTGPELCSTKKSTFEPVGLTVAEGNVYTIIAAQAGEECHVVTTAKEIVDWSTTPSDGKLVAASSAQDHLSTPVTAGGVEYTVPSLVSGSGALTAPPVYSPRGLAVDGSGSLAILGDANDRFLTGEPTNAPALAVQVSTATGAETASWSSASFNLPEDQADTISTAPNGIGVLLNGGSTSLWDLVELTPSLTSPHLLASEAQDPPSIYQFPFNLALSAENPAGPHGLWLSNGLYASVLTHGNSLYWNSQEGIRLISPLGDGTLSNTTGTDTVYDTLGQTASGACNITAGGSAGALADVVLAAGKEGAVWMLNVGKDSGSTHIGRVVTEFEPNAADPCVGPPAGTTFSLADKSPGSPPAQLASAGPLTVSVGSPVQFSTGEFEYPTVFGSGSEPAAVFAFEWDPEYGASHDPGYGLVEQEVSGFTQPTWPADTPEHIYTEPGTYTVKMKALGELGEYDATGTVIVQTSNPPTAAFTLPSTAQTNQSVSLDASGSQPAGGSSIADYHWEFGDGAEDDTQTPAETHAYSAAGTYTVTLTVRDADNRQSTAVTHQITVTAPSTGTGTGGSGSTGTSPSTGGGSNTAPAPTPKPTTTKKPSAAATAKKKLAAALKVCEKKPAKKRAACEKQARAKYSGKSKKK